MMRSIRDDQGQTSVFIIGVTVVILLFSLTIAAIMSVTLEHRKLLSIADSAAQTAATSFTVANPDDLSLVIGAEAANKRVVQHLADVNANDRFSNLNVEAVRVVDGTTVTVQLSASAHPPIVNWVLPSGVRVVADSTARTQLEQ